MEKLVEDHFILFLFLKSASLSARCFSRKEGLFLDRTFGYFSSSWSSSFIIFFFFSWFVELENAFLTNYFQSVFPAIAVASLVSLSDLGFLWSLSISRRESSSPLKEGGKKKAGCEMRAESLYLVFSLPCEYTEVQGTGVLALPGLLITVYFNIFPLWGFPRGRIQFLSHLGYADLLKVFLGQNSASADNRGSGFPLLHGHAV